MTTEDTRRAAFDVKVERIGGTTILSVRGEVDLSTSNRLGDAIDAALAEPEPAALIVDLTGVPFFASVGMTVLVDANRRVGANAKFIVVADGPATARPLMLVGLDQTFPIYTDREAAMAALAPDPIH